MVSKDVGAEANTVVFRFITVDEPWPDVRRVAGPNHYSPALPESIEIPFR